MTLKPHVTVAKFSSSQIFVDSNFRCPQLPTKITKFCTQRIFPAIRYLYLYFCSWLYLSIFEKMYCACTCTYCTWRDAYTTHLQTMCTYMSCTSTLLVHVLTAYMCLPHSGPYVRVHIHVHVCTRSFFSLTGKMFPSQGILYCAPFTDEMLYMEQYNKASFWCVCVRMSMSVYSVYVCLCVCMSECVGVCTCTCM